MTLLGELRGTQLALKGALGATKETPRGPKRAMTIIDAAATKIEATFTTRDTIGDFVDEENALIDAAAKNIEANYKKGLDGKDVLGNVVDDENAVVDAAAEKIASNTKAKENLTSNTRKPYKPFEKPYKN